MLGRLLALGMLLLLLLLCLFTLGNLLLLLCKLPLLLLLLLLLLLPLLLLLRRSRLQGHTSLPQQGCLLLPHRRLLLLLQQCQLLCHEQCMSLLLGLLLHSQCRLPLHGTLLRNVLLWWLSSRCRPGHAGGTRHAPRGRAAALCHGTATAAALLARPLRPLPASASAAAPCAAGQLADRRAVHWRAPLQWQARAPALHTQGRMRGDGDLALFCVTSHTLGCDPAVATAAP